jgi:hypothetical protein
MEIGWETQGMQREFGRGNLPEYEGVFKSFWTCRLERELLSATRCSCIAILWESLESFAAIIFRVASQGCLLLLFISLSTQSGNFWIHPSTSSWKLEKDVGRYYNDGCREVAFEDRRCLNSLRIVSNDGFCYYRCWALRFCYHSTSY